MDTQAQADDRNRTMERKAIRMLPALCTERALHPERVTAGEGGKDGQERRSDPETPADELFLHRKKRLAQVTRLAVKASLSCASYSTTGGVPPPSKWTAPSYPRGPYSSDNARLRKMLPGSIYKSDATKPIRLCCSRQPEKKGQGRFEGQALDEDREQHDNVGHWQDDVLFVPRRQRQGHGDG